MDFELNEDQRAFAQTARDFAVAELAPHAAEWDAQAIFPKATIAKAGELGFCGLYAPESIGGLALPRLDATLVFEEMAAYDPSTTAFITIHNMATWMLGTWATAQDPRRPNRHGLPHQRRQGLYLGRRRHRRAGAHGPHGRCPVGRARHQRLCRASRCPRHQLRQEGRKNGLEQPAHPHHQLRQRRNTA